MPSKFILIDNALVDFAGHHYQYASHVLAAARKAGHIPILATNRRYTSQPSDDWCIYPIYEYGYWLYQTHPFLLSKLRAALVYHGKSSPNGSVYNPPLKRLENLIRSSYNCLRRRSFALSTQNLFRSLKLDAADVVFVPNSSHIELAGAWDYLNQNYDQASWHFLFRQDMLLSADPAHEIRATRDTLALFKEVPAKVRFYTDTDELTEQYNSLQATQFRTLPIPHTYASKENGYQPHRPFCITYLGDARAEKGYHHLSLIIDGLRDYLQRGLVRFLIQSHSPARDDAPLVSSARVKLEERLSEKVSMITSTLSPEEYRETLFASDIVLLPYEEERYRTRSSGILVESLAAGKPVLVPNRTWMATQMQNEKVGLVFDDFLEVPSLLRSMIDHYADFYQAAQDRSIIWRQWHNASNLVSLLSQ